MSNKIKTILMGTSEFAENIFKKIYPVLQDNFKITHIITAPDKPKGRKKQLIPSPVKEFAQKNNISVLQPKKINQEIEKIKKINPDLIILCAYGQIIPKEILDIPKYKALNIHPSLLPKHRGASPIHTAILNNDKVTGISLMIMDEKMDHGPIISQQEHKIKENITYKELENELVETAVDLLKKDLLKYINKKIQPKPQDHKKASFCKIIKKQDGKIDWNTTAEQIQRKIRAFHEWPTTYTFFNNKQLKILKADVKKENINNKPGKVNKNLEIQTKNKTLIIKELQLEGKKPILAKEFLNGHAEIIDTIL